MPAKDIIDIDIECTIGNILVLISQLENLGYVHQGNQGIDGRESFLPSDHSPSSKFPAHHLYACESNALELFNHLAFRNYLRLNSDRVIWLANKKRMADSTAKSRNEYIENKADCYNLIRKESLEWAKKTMQWSADASADL